MAKSKQIDNRDTLTDHVCEYMQDNCRAMTIDTLLTRPADAIQMGLSVATKSGKISMKTAKFIAARLKEIVEHDPKAIDEIDEVCRCALAARKRGDLKRDPV